MVKYNKRTWLNSIESDSTGSIVTFDGQVTWGDNLIDSTFLEISDCKNKVRLHLTTDDTKEDFITKLELLKTEIELFINHLKN